jgi:hypothetical protein
VYSVLGVSESAAAHLRGLGLVGIVGRVLCGGLAALKSVREFSFLPEHSIAAGYGEALREWLPEAMELTLVARHEGRDAASVNAFIDAAKGRAKTLTFVETENGGSISGCYLDVAWVEGDWTNDPRRRSFTFTLRNPHGVPPTRFAQKRGEKAAYMDRCASFYAGLGERLDEWAGGLVLHNDETYDRPGPGRPLLHLNGDGLFRAARWELWQVE